MLSHASFSFENISSIFNNSRILNKCKTIHQCDGAQRHTYNHNALLSIEDHNYLDITMQMALKRHVVQRIRDKIVHFLTKALHIHSGLPQSHFKDWRQSVSVLRRAVATVSHFFLIGPCSTLRNKENMAFSGFW